MRKITVMLACLAIACQGSRVPSSKDSSGGYLFDHQAALRVARASSSLLQTNGSIGQSDETAMLKPQPSTGKLLLWLLSMLSVPSTPFSQSVGSDKRDHLGAPMGMSGQHGPSRQFHDAPLGLHVAEPRGASAATMPLVEPQSLPVAIFDHPAAKEFPLPALRIRSSEQRFRHAAEVTGNSVWAGSACLLQWLCELEHRRLFASKAVVELGAGTGHLGLGLAMSGARSVLLSDLEQQLPLLRANIDLNVEARDRVRAAAQRWGTVVPGGAFDQHFDLVVGSELVYAEHLLEPLAFTTASLLQHPISSSDRPTVAIFAMSRHRAYAKVPDNAHHFIYDLLVEKHGLHAVLVGSYDHPEATLGDGFFVGAQAAEGDMPVSIFKVSSEREDARGRFGA